MGLAKPSESETTSSLVEDNHQTTDSRDIASSVKDTYTNRDAISSLQYPESLNSLLSRADGTHVTVEYYKKRHSFINNQLGDTSFSLESNSIHRSYDLIHSFEMLIDGDIDIAQNAETGEFEGDGKGFVYPGFKPHTGDIFLLRLLDAQIGVFVVNDVTKLSVSRSAYFEVTFVLYTYLTDELISKLAGSVRDELYFNKDKYFSDTVTILTDTTHAQLAYLLKMEQRISKYLVARFYNDELHSFINGSVYDPNVVSFLTSIMSSSTNIYQVTSAFANQYKNTILGSLVNRDIASMTINRYKTCSYTNYAWDSYVSRASNHDILIVDDDAYLGDKRIKPLNDDVLSYVFSNRFYFALNAHFETGFHVTDITDHIPEIEQADSPYGVNSSNEVYLLSSNEYISYEDILDEDTSTILNNDVHLSDLEYVVLRYLTDNELDIQKLVDDMLTKFPYDNMRKEDRFYILPVMLLLTRAAIHRLR